MCSDKGKIEFVRSFVENAFIEGHMSRCDEKFSMDVIVHGPDTNRKTVGLANTKKIDQGFSEAFERNRLEINEIFCKEDKVVVLWQMEATHKGELKVLTEKPISATHSKIRISVISIYRLENGKICEVWQGWDLQGMLLNLKQLEDHQKLDFSKIEKKDEYLRGAYTLSDRERECLKCLLKGDTAKETGKQLHLSFRTVESYIETAKNKLGCTDKRELFKASLFLKRLKLI